MKKNGQTVIRQPDAVEPAAKVLLCGGAGPLPASDRALFDEAFSAYAGAHDFRCCSLLGEAEPGSSGAAACAERLLKNGFDLLPLAGLSADSPPAVRSAVPEGAFLGAGATEALAYRPKVLLINGVRLGFLSFGERPYRGGAFDGFADILHPAVYDHVRMLLPQCDHVVVFCHAGLPGGALPLPEWRARFLRFLDAGATIVACTGPGAAAGWEEHACGAAFYGLGTLADDHADGENRSLAVSVSFERNGRFAYETRALTYASGAVSLSGDEAFLTKLGEQNELFQHEAAYRDAAERMCRAYCGANEAELFPARREKRPRLFAGRSGRRANEERASYERRLRLLLMDESRRLAVLRALGAAEREKTEGPA